MLSTISEEDDLNILCLSAAVFEALTKVSLPIHQGSYVLVKAPEKLTY